MFPYHLSSHLQEKFDVENDEEVGATNPLADKLRMWVIDPAHESGSNESHESDQSRSGVWWDVCPRWLQGR